MTLVPLFFWLVSNQVIQYLFWIEFLVSKETVVLRRWERSKQKFGFIKRVEPVSSLFRLCRFSCIACRLCNR